MLPGSMVSGAAAKLADLMILKLLSETLSGCCGGNGWLCVSSRGKMPGIEHHQMAFGSQNGHDGEQGRDSRFDKGEA